MPSTLANNNKRIAKNTLYLYMRMILMTIISLYTSRVVLNTLGISDFGIYNVIGGIVAMFSFISASMQSASQRFMAYELGKNNEKKFNEIFNSSLILYIIIGFILLIGAETVGLWFVCEKINVDNSSFERVMYVYQLSIATTFLLLLRIPFLSGVISQENMSFFAINSIFEALLKLGLIYFLVITNVDKLILYCWLILGVTLLTNLIYAFRCRYKYRNLYKLDFHIPKDILIRITTFSSWRTLGAFSQMTDKQGTNVVLNIFWGPLVNAAMGIANQVYTAAYSLLSGFQQAFSPAIIKFYANDNKVELQKIVYNSSIISFLLISICCIPAIVNIDYILNLWLIEVAKYSSEFCIILLFNLVIDSYSAPLYTVILATGKIATYQIVLSFVTLLGFGSSIILAYLDITPVIILLPKIVVTIALLLYRLNLTAKITDIDVNRYFSKILLVPLLLFLGSIVLVHSLSYLMSELSLLCVSVLFSISIYPALIYFLALDKSSRMFVKKFIIKKIFKKNEG